MADSKTAPDRFLERIAQAHGHSMTKALRDMLFAAYRAGANSQKPDVGKVNGFADGLEIGS